MISDERLAELVQLYTISEPFTADTAEALRELQRRRQPAVPEQAEQPWLGLEAWLA